MLGGKRWKPPRSSQGEHGFSQWNPNRNILGISDWWTITFGASPRKNWNVAGWISWGILNYIIWIAPAWANMAIKKHHFQERISLWHFHYLFYRWICNIFCFFATDFQAFQPFSVHVHFLKIWLLNLWPKTPFPNIPLDRGEVDFARALGPPSGGKECLDWKKNGPRI